MAEALARVLQFKELEAPALNRLATVKTVGEASTLLAKTAAAEEEPETVVPVLREYSLVVQALAAEGFLSLNGQRLPRQAPAEATPVVAALEFGKVLLGLAGLEALQTGRCVTRQLQMRLTLPALAVEVLAEIQAQLAEALAEMVS